MVTIIAAHLRESEKGAFVSLELRGSVELVQSSTTGRFYATARRCFISCTFDHPTANALVGTQMQGNIVRIPCEPYEYVVPETGEIVMLAHSYDYRPENQEVGHSAALVSQE